uniref:Uncharacterized protein n=1 Tax=Arundo donax TaxID=35708 RepID=A0A0A8YV47_ARUDO
MPASYAFILFFLFGFA